MGSRILRYGMQLRLRGSVARTAVPGRKLSDHAGRNASPELPSRNVADYDRAGCDNRAFSERDTGTDGHARVHSDKPLHSDLSEPDGRHAEYWHSHGVVICRGENHRAGPAAESFGYLYLSGSPQDAVRSKERRRTNPNRAAPVGPFESSTVQDRTALNAHVLSELQEVWIGDGDTVTKGGGGKSLLEPPGGLILRVDLLKTPPVVPSSVWHDAHAPSLHLTCRQMLGHCTVRP